MKERNIILASASPRRKELLDQIGLKHRVISSTDREIIEEGISPQNVAMSLAIQKAKAVSKKISGNYLIIAADTVVSADKVLGKPQGEQQAFEMLKALRDRWHEVVTGIAIIDTLDNRMTSFYEITKVKMRAYQDSEIDAYINSGEPMDKAGSYGIQGLGALLVERIEGCYFNVVGLPIQKLGEILKDFDVSVL